MTTSVKCYSKRAARGYPPARSLPAWRMVPRRDDHTRSSTAERRGTRAGSLPQNVEGLADASTSPAKRRRARRRIDEPSVSSSNDVLLARPSYFLLPFLPPPFLPPF